MSFSDGTPYTHCFRYNRSLVQVSPISEEKSIFFWECFKNFWIRLIRLQFSPTMGRPELHWVLELKYFCIYLLEGLKNQGKIAKFVHKLSCSAKFHPSTMKMLNLVLELFKLIRLHPCANAACHRGLHRQHPIRLGFQLVLKCPFYPCLFSTRPLAPSSQSGCCLLPSRAQRRPSPPPQS